VKSEGDGEKRAMWWPAFHGAYWVMSLWSMTYHRSVTCALRRTPGTLALPCRFRKSRISPAVPGPDWRGGGGRRGATRCAQGSHVLPSHSKLQSETHHRTHESTPGIEPEACSGRDGLQGL
jgi:hypothetical protein